MIEILNMLHEGWRVIISVTEDNEGNDECLPFDELGGGDGDNEKLA